MSFANKLKGLMEELDLTQAKVSDLTGIGRSSISQYVSGKNEPSKERRKEIARSLGVQDNYFEEYDPVATVQYNSTVNLPVELVAKLMKKSPRFVRRGLQDGVFPWGYAVSWNIGVTSFPLSSSPNAPGFRFPLLRYRHERQVLRTLRSPLPQERSRKA